MNDIQCHVCPPSAKGMLPMKIVNHAAAGRIPEVCKWLDDGGDINAADNLNQTLMHIACMEEQAGLVKKLLEYPDIHLNVRSNTKDFITPLGIAASNGFLDLIQILLEAQQSKCNVNLGMSFGTPGLRNSRITAIIIAIQYKHWSVVKLMLKHYQNMRDTEAYSGLCQSIENYEFDIAMSIIQKKNPLEHHEFGTFIQDVYRNKQWELLEAILRKNVFYKNDTSKKLFYYLVVERDWSNLERFLRITDNDVKINVNLAEAIVERKAENVKKLLEHVKNDKDVITGTFYVAVIAGSTEDMVNLFLNEVAIQYSDNTLDNALIIASINNRLEFVPELLKKKIFSYHILSRARIIGLSNNRMDVNNLLAKTMEERLKEFSSTQKVATEDEAKNAKKEDDS